MRNYTAPRAQCTGVRYPGCFGLEYESSSHERDDNAQLHCAMHIAVVVMTRNAYKRCDYNTQC